MREVAPASAVVAVAKTKPSAIVLAGCPEEIADAIAKKVCKLEGPIVPMLAVAKDNLGLLKYLISQLLATRAKKFAALQGFVPEAKEGDWVKIIAGQRGIMIE